MGLYARLAGVPLRIDSYALEGLELAVSSGFTRRTTVIRLRGGGHEGVGEDVTYDPDEHERLQAGGPVHDLAGEHAFDGFSELLASLDLFPASALEHDVWRNYRRWGFESAALDLALRQAGTSLADALGLESAPVRYVVSRRLADPPTTEPLRRLLGFYPDLRYKLDPTSSWTPELVAELAALGCVETVDLKSAYRGTVVDQPADPALYRLVAEGLPGAWIEDPDLGDPALAAILESHLDRVSWDAVVTSLADLDALPFPPRGLNVKPSRFGSLRMLLDVYDTCRERGILMYGGGQFELGPGRTQIQHLASLFHPDAPNDVAPIGFHAPEPAAGLEPSPLAPPVAFGEVAALATRA
jgi:hypothetical protein